MMERASRIVVLISTILAAVSYAAVSGIIVPGAEWWGFGALVLGLLASRVFTAAGAIVVSLIYVAPALLMAAFGRAEYHLLSVWLAALAGVTAGAADWTRWHVPARWQWPLIAWALLVALMWPVVAGREADFSLVALMSTDTPNAILGGPPAPSVAWVISVALAHLLSFLWMDLLWTRFGHGKAPRMERLILLPMLISATLTAVASLYQDYVDVTWASTSVWIEMQRSAGLMLDANSAGMAAALWLAAGVVLVWRLGLPTVWTIPVILLLGASMWSSGSRTALLTALAGGTGIALAIGSAGRRARLAAAGGLAVAAVLLAAVALSGASGQSNPVTRSLARFRGVSPPSAAEFATELWTRDGYGTASVHAFREHPITGVGIGAFNLLAGDYLYLSSGRTVVADNAQNWWRQQVAELGAGAVAPFAVSLLVISLIARRPPTTIPSTIVIKAALIGVGLVSLVGVSTQHPALLITFVTLVVWLALLTGVEGSGLVASRGRLWWTTMVLLMAVVVGGHIWSAQRDLRVPFRAVRVGFPYSYGFSPEDTTPNGPVRWTAQEAAAVLPAEHRFLDLTTWTRHPDVAERPVQVRIWKDGELVADFMSRDAQPRTTTLEMQPAQQRVLVEIDVSRTFADGRGAQIAARWRRE